MTTYVNTSASEIFSRFKGPKITHFVTQSVTHSVTQSVTHSVTHSVTLTPRLDFVESYYALRTA